MIFLQRLGLGPGLSSDAELRNLRELNDDLERQVGDLHREVREKDKQLAEERKISEQVADFLCFPTVVYIVI